jgi:glutamate 5-kinase
MEISSMRNKNESVVELLDNDETASQISVLLKSKYLLIMTSADGLLKNSDDPSSVIERVEGKDTYELIENIDGLVQYCNGSSRKGANGMLAKLQYIKEPVKNGTIVIIGSPKYTIPDLIQGNVKRTIFSVR